MTINLRRLLLRGNGLDDQRISTIIGALLSCEQITQLDCAHNEIGFGSVVAFVDLLMQSSSLRSLDLAHNCLDHDCVMSIVSVLNLRNSSLKKLVLDRPRFTSVMQESAWHLNRMLRVNVGLSHLSLRQWQLRSDGLHTICQSLYDNSSLRELDLRANQIDVEGAETLRSYLQDASCRLRKLWLSRNKIGEQGAKAMAQAIAVNTSLVMIDLQDNNIPDQGSRRIAESISENHKLKVLLLWGNDLSQSNLEIFWHQFTRNDVKSRLMVDFDIKAVGHNLYAAHTEVDPSIYEFGEY